MTTKRRSVRESAFEFVGARSPWGLILLMLAMGCASSEESHESFETSRQSICDLDDRACVLGLSPPRPKWGEQPDRLPPAYVDLDPSDPSSLGHVVACNPDLLGKLPVNPNPKGPDLQNISTNFHVLQSLQILASAVQKAAAVDTALDSALYGKNAQGQCICSPAATCTSAPSLHRAGATKAECLTFCDPASTAPDKAVCSAGYLSWLPNDVFKNANGTPKWALQTIHWLDAVPGYIEDQLGDSLEAIGGELANRNDTLSLFQCYVDLFTEGYHLGGYSEDRPDLHQCVPYAGHGVYASLADSSSGRWGIGAKYRSYNLSKTHPAQMRQAGFEVTAFGKSLSILPGTEFNLQIDGYRWLHGDAPLGIPELAEGGGGVTLAEAATLDIFDLVNHDQLASLDSDADGRISPQEFLLASYSPFPYTPEGLPQTEWPRQGAIGVDPYEGGQVSVLAAAFNYDAQIKPIRRELPGLVIVPGATLTPYFSLTAGAGWFDEAYRLRKRLAEALNKHSSLNITNADFDRNQHPLQAPDMTAELGTTVSVKPEVGASLNVGFKVGKRAELGVRANLGFSVDLKPTGSGGVVDLNSALEKALVTSNPREGLECKPTWSYEDAASCSNRDLPGSTENFACSVQESANSCCISFSGIAPLRLCIDDYTGIDKTTCLNGKMTRDLLSQYISPSALAQIQSALGTSYTTKWGAGKSCAKCESDGSCKNSIKSTDYAQTSGCEKHGYCCLPYDTLVAGQPEEYAVVDGTGTGAAFWKINGTAYDETTSSMFVSDRYKLRQVDMSTGQVTTLAGGNSWGSNDGVGTAAGLQEPAGLAVDERYVYIGDAWRIRRYDKVTRQVTTLAVLPYDFQSLAPPASVVDVALAQGGLFITRTNCAVYRMDLSTRAVEVFAGSPTGCGVQEGATAQFNHPRGLAYDGAGGLFVADKDNHRIRYIDLATREVSTVAGTGELGTVDGYAATLTRPSSLSFDGDNLYFTEDKGDSTLALRKYTHSTGRVATVQPQAPGQPTQPRSNPPPAAPPGPAVPAPEVEAEPGGVSIGQIETVHRLDFSCHTEIPDGVLYDVSEAECGGTFTPYRCMTDTTATHTGWTGPGCHPLHAGFPTANGCTTQADCAGGESCNVAQGRCERSGGAVAASCNPSVCSSGRSCRTGACVKTCAYSPSTADTVCGPSLTCTTQNVCGPRGGMQFAEQIAWGLRNPTQPMHTIASYAMSELELIAALNAGIHVGLKVKLFKKERDFTLWKWGRSFDLGSIEKGNFQPGLEASYQWDTSALGSVVNYQPENVTRYPAITSAYDETKELLDWCEPAMAADVHNPLPPVLEDIGRSLTETIDFGFDVGQSVWDQNQLCVNGTRMTEWLQNESAVTAAFADATCEYIGPVSGSRGPTTFACDTAHIDSLRLWGCLDVTGYQASQIAAAYPHMVDYSTTPRTFDLNDMMRDTSLPLEARNLWIRSPHTNTWLQQVENCFNAHFEQTVPCTCTTDADCDTAPGQTCVAGTCKDQDNAVVQCAQVRTQGIEVQPCCGDGHDEAGEACDDGNVVSGDGCSAACESETEGGACCTATRCLDFGEGGVTNSATCRAAGGQPFSGKSCAMMDSCGVEVVGVCMLDGDCLSPALESQCSDAGGDFVENGECESCSGPPPSLMAHYPLDERTGTVAKDVAFGRNGTYSANIARITGRVSGAATIDGSDVITIPDNPGLDFGSDDFTFSTWVRSTTGGTLFEKRSSGTIRGLLFVMTPTRPLLQMADETGWTNLLGTSTNVGNALNGAWHLVTLSVDRDSTTGGRLYVDNQLVWTFNPTQRKRNLDNTAPLTIGDGRDQSQINGDMDEVMFFRRALTPAEVSHLIEAGEVGVCQ